MANWWDSLGTSIGDNMIGMQMPFGMAPPTDPAQRAQMINPMLLQMGASMLAGRKQNPAVNIGNAISNAQQFGSQQMGRNLYAAQIAQSMEDRKTRREEDNKTRLWAKSQPWASQYPVDQMSSEDIFKIAVGANKPPDMPNWQTVTTADGVMAFNPQTRQMEKIGNSPARQSAFPNGYEADPANPGKIRMIPGWRDTDYENKLRGEFQSQTKDFRDVRDSYNRIQASANNPSPAGDLALIFNYMKMLDPGSVVRESEFSTAQTAAPFLTRVGIDPEKVSAVLSGQRLTPEQRQDFISRADAIYGQQENTFNSLADEYKALAQKNGFDPDSIVLTPKAQRMQSSAPDGGKNNTEWQTDQFGNRIRQVSP